MQREFDASWSPDSKWVAYSKSLESHMRAIFLYSIATGKATQVTDRMADAISPAFDANGKIALQDHLVAENVRQTNVGFTNRCGGK